MSDSFSLVVPEDVYSHRAAACRQRVTTYKTFSNRICLKTEYELRSMFVSASVGGRSSHANSMLYWPQPLLRAKMRMTRRFGNRATKAEGPPESPSCGNRATRAALHKTTQRRLPACKHRWLCLWSPAGGTKLGNPVQPGVVAEAGYTSQRRVPRRGSRVLTINVELADGDFDVAVHKVGEVQKDVQDVEVVIVAVDPQPRKRSGNRRSKTPEAGALKTPVKTPQSSAAREVLVREARSVQRHEAA